MPTPLNQEFYVTGGTLRADAPSYIERDADQRLLEGLLAGEFCYVLTARQMGKSSLMVRTAQKLRERGTRVIMLDLTAIGQNLVTEQWYAGLLAHAARQVGREEAMEAFWDHYHRLGPCQRFFAGLRELLVPEAARPSGEPADDWVVFVDEIDAVRSLQFSTDEFFAAVREQHNRRSLEPGQPRLTFCLLGVATPTDLIKDTRTTPFNVGRRIELGDFTRSEALSLARGLERIGPISERRRRAEALEVLGRIVAWTGGHPYLTQRLCQAAAEANVGGGSVPGHIAGRRGVDALCARLFLSAEARERDDNLLFVRERLLRSERDTAAVLDLYRKVRQGAAVPASDTDPLVSILRLSGIARAGPYGLEVRNRIYREVFDGAWIRQNLPGAELRRQEEAYRRGLVRATVLAALIIVVITVLLAIVQRNARVGRERLTRLYTATGVRRLEQGDSLGALPWFFRAARSAAASSAESDLARLRLGILLDQTPRLAQLWWQSNGVNSIRFDPSGERAVSAGNDGDACVWDPNTGERLAQFPHEYWLPTAVFLPGNKLLTLDDYAGRLAVWDWVQRRALWTLPDITHALFDPGAGALLAASHDGSLHWHDLDTGDETERSLAPVAVLPSVANRVVVSPDGVWIAALAKDQHMLMVAERSGSEWRVLHADSDHELLDAAFSPDGRQLAAGGSDHAVRVWTIPGLWRPAYTNYHKSWVHRVKFSPDSRWLVTCSSDASARLWYAEDGRSATSPLRHEHAVRYVDFSPNSDLVVTCGYEGTARVWNTTNGEPVLPPLPHSGFVTWAAFRPASNQIATAGIDGTVRLWQMPQGPRSLTLAGHSDRVTSMEFSPSRDRLLTGGEDGLAIVWDPVAGRQLCRVTHRGRVNRAVFGPDGTRFATASSDGAVGVWATEDGTPAPGWLAGHRTNVVGVVFAPRRGLLATGDSGGQIVIWSAGSGQILHRLTATNREPILQLEFNEDGSLLAAALHASTGETNSVQVWNAVSGTIRSVLDHPMAAGHIEFGPDRHRLVVSECDPSLDPGRATIWNLRGNPLVLTNLMHSDGVKCSAVSPSGKILATACEDGTARLWELPECRPVTSPLRHGYQVTSVAFSANSHLLLTVSGSGNVMLWDARTGEPMMAPLEPPRGRLVQSSLSPDGRKIAVGTDQGEVFVWLLASADEPIKTLATRIQLRAGYRLNEDAVQEDLTGPELRTLWEARSRE